VIFVRSRRPTFLLAAATALIMVGLAAAAACAAIWVSAAAGVLFAILAVFALGFLLRAALRLRRWPASRSSSTAKPSCGQAGTVWPP
jgi:membrane protein implicated in regulation of membrane protease activity